MRWYIPPVLLLTLSHAGLVYDSRGSPEFTPATAEWGSGDSFPIGYYTPLSRGAGCTRGSARFQTLSYWVGSAAGEGVVSLDIELRPPASQPTSCVLRLSLFAWDEILTPGSPVGSQVEYLVNGTVPGMQQQQQTIPIPASSGWVLSPSRFYGLEMQGMESCGGLLPASERYLRIALAASSPSSPGDTGGTLWPSQGDLDVGCPGGAASFVSSTPLSGAAWRAALSTRTALVLRGSEASPAFPGTSTVGLPLGPNPQQAMQLIWERLTLDLTLLEVRVSLYGTGNPGVTSFNATLRLTLCFLDTNNDCLGTSSLPTTVKNIEAVIPGGGAPTAATTFALPSGLPSGFVAKSSYRTALRLSVISLVASDGSPPPSVGSNTCKLLTCGANAGVTDPGVTSAVFLVDTYSGDGSQFYPNYPPGTGPPVNFPCMAVRVVPTDPNVVFPTPTPTPPTTPTPSPTPNESPSLSPTSTPTPSPTPSFSPSPTSSGSPSLTTPTPSPSLGGSPPSTPSPTTTSSPTPTLTSTPGGASTASKTPSLSSTPSPTYIPPTGPSSSSSTTANTLTPGGAAGVSIFVLLLLAGGALFLAYHFTPSTLAFFAGYLGLKSTEAALNRRAGGVGGGGGGGRPGFRVRGKGVLGASARLAQVKGGEVEGEGEGQREGEGDGGALVTVNVVSTRNPSTVAAIVDEGGPHLTTTQSSEIKW